MKLPTDFVPEKGLEKKTEELVKESKIFKEPPRDYLEDLAEKAIWVATYKGENMNLTDVDYQHYYTFTDSDNNLEISYRAIIDPQSRRFEFAYFEVTVKHNNVTVFYKTNKKLGKYTGGKWEDHIDNVYGDIPKT